jgi:DNA-binding CsgD family transcriptional regulator
MSDLELFDALLSEIYERTGTPAEWPELLARLTAFIGGRVGQLAVFSLDGLQRPTWAVSGYDREQYRSFLYRHATEDPRLNYILANPGRIVRGEDGVDPARFQASPLYIEVIRPFDIEHSLVSFFAREGSVMATLAAMRGRDRGAFGNEEIARFGLVVPHLRRAFELYALLDQAKTTLTDIGAALDLVDAGVFLADGDLRVAHANRAAEDLLRSGDGIAVRAGRLHCSDPRAARKLAAAASLAIEAARGRHELVNADHIEVPRRDGEEPYRISLHPLPKRAGRSALGVRAELAVVVRRPGQSAAETARRLQAALHLTPAEAALAANLAAGRSLDDHARERGVAISTVRSQLKALFAKTETNRQGELVATLRRNLDVTLT